MIDLVRRHIIPAAFAVLPPEMASCFSDTISVTARPTQRRAAPHTATSGGCHVMAKSASLCPAGRTSNGTPLFRRACRGCGAVSLVDSRKLDKCCMACSNRSRSTHGLSKHPLYKKLKNIEVRCRYESASNYEYYGRRGVSVCQEWLSDPAVFVAWAEARGWKKGLEIDRIDPDGNYEPGNCRVLSHRENSQRTRRITTSHDQVRSVRAALQAGASIRAAATSAGVSYAVAYHIKNTPDVWSNVS